MRKIKKKVDRSTGCTVRCPAKNKVAKEKVFSDKADELISILTFMIEQCDVGV